VNQTCLSGAATCHLWYLQYFNLKTAGITSGILDFGGTLYCFFSWAANKRSWKCIHLYFSPHKYQQASVTVYITRTITGALPNSQHYKHKLIFFLSRQTTAFSNRTPFSTTAVLALLVVRPGNSAIPFQKLDHVMDLNIFYFPVLYIMCSCSIIQGLSHRKGCC